MFDVGVLVLANTTNDNIAKQAARAAASAQGAANAAPGDHTYHDNALAAANAILARYGKTSNNNAMWKACQLTYFNYHDVGGPFDNGGSVPAGVPNGGDPGLGNVQVVTTFDVQCPVAFPGFDGVKSFQSRVVEPIVSQPPT